MGLLANLLLPDDIYWQIYYYYLMTSTACYLLQFHHCRRYLKTMMQSKITKMEMCNPLDLLCLHGGVTGVLTFLLYRRLYSRLVASTSSLLSFFANGLHQMIVTVRGSASEDQIEMRVEARDLAHSWRLSQDVI
jgi:hypothetical protein